MNIESIDAKSVRSFGKDLLNTYRDEIHSFEEAANLVVENIHKTFIQDDGEITFGLVQIFRLFRYEELNLDIQQQVNPDDKWMVLMGEISDDEYFIDPAMGVNDFMINLETEDGELFHTLFDKFGFTEETTQRILDGQSSIFSTYVHIPDINENISLSDQDSSVLNMLQSAVVIGSRFLSDSVYICLAYSKVPLSKDAASKLAKFAPYVSTLLAIFDGRETLWE